VLSLSPRWRALAPSAGEALATAIRNAVLDGTIPAGNQLPAERRLASQLGISRGTVVTALARLRAEGWLSTQRGSGSTVRIPDSLRIRYAPLQVDHADGLLDLRLAVPAAPVDAYTAAVQRALARSTRVLLSDGGPGPGLPELREQVAARLTGQGLPTRPDQVLITGGARAALTLLVAHLRPGAAVVESPAYNGILSIARRPGRRLVPVPVTSEGWDEDRLRAAFGEARGGIALLVPDFHNPTGALMSSQTRAHIAALAASTGVTVIVDEIMRDLDLRDPSAPMPRVRGAITVGSLSKTVWSGLRTGWIRAPARLVRELLLNPLCAACTAPPLEQLTACELLPGLDGLISQRTSELRSQRDHLAAALRHDTAWTFTPPRGGLWLWLHMAHTSGDALAAQAAAFGLAVLPGSAFSADGTPGSYLRVPFTAPPETLSKAAAILKDAHTMLPNISPARERCRQRTPR
jgi:DNA-binding transcriptional MocR family regulator